MDEKMVKEWEEKMRRNHKGEEDTEHFKEEIAFIQNIHQQITSGKISHYTNYNIEAEKYDGIKKVNKIIKNRDIISEKSLILGIDILIFLC